MVSVGRQFSGAQHLQVITVARIRYVMFFRVCAPFMSVPTRAAMAAGKELGTMPYVTCPTCGERGKIPPNLVGARIKCRKCGLGFTVSPPVAKGAAAASTQATSPAGPSAVAEPLQGGIEVEGLDASSWALPTETATLLKTDGASAAAPEPSVRAEAGSPFVAAEPGQSVGREYKLLTSRDKMFDGKFDLARLEEAINLYARQGWTAKSMMIPHLKGYTGAMEEVICVLLERG
jgi:hypothetical protein